MAYIDRDVALERYSNDADALIGLARQLADAYEETRSTADEEFAADAVDDFLSDHDEFAPDEALVALLDLPMTRLTWPLVDSVETILAARGRDAVRPLAEAVGRRVYDRDGPTPGRARETLAAMPPADLVAGLLDILRSRTEDDLKAVCARLLVEAGETAVPALEAAACHRVAGRWAEDALGDIRAQRAGRSDTGS